jgi:hypothetical protein
MASDRPRATRACATCRRLKTRCYESTVPGSSCLRCEKLGAECSLANRISIGSSSLSATTTVPAAPRPQEARLDRLERVIIAIANKVGIDVDIGSSIRNVTDGIPATTTQLSAPVSHSSENGTAPVFAIRDIANESGVESPTASRIVASGSNIDLIAEGLLSKPQAKSLFELSVIHPTSNTS